VYTLRAFTEPRLIEDVVATLRDLPQVRHIVLGGLTDDTDKMLVMAEVEAVAVDEAFEALQRLGVEADDLSVSRADFAGPVPTKDDEVEDRGDDQALVWAEVAEAAVANVGLRPIYLVYMAVAGVIAAFGVLTGSSVLIVGAMAVSPDLLPMSAACVAIVARRPHLLGRALGTMGPGLGLVVLAAFLLTTALRVAGEVSPATDVVNSHVGELATVSVATFGVALAAGVAGMLAFETRASFAVGVAISVTTVPAAAFIGVGAGLEQWSMALSALEVLAVNLAALVLSGVVTLAIQARLELRRGHAAPSQRAALRALRAGGEHPHVAYPRDAHDPASAPPREAPGPATPDHGGRPRDGADPR
jgi:uncharacterized hydrophobic protein (TIGR00271 family)